MNAREREATARRLGWPRLLEALSDFSRTPLGRRRVALLAPLPDRASVLRRLTEIEAVRQLRAGGFDLPLGDLPEVEDPLDRVRKAGVLEGKALRDLAAVLRAAADCATYLVRHAEVLGSVSERLRGLGGQERLAREIERSIAPSGEVEDEASEALAEARARVRRLHEGQRRRAEALLRDPAWQERLQEAWFSVRNDRYVLPVKAQFRYQVGGIVHNVSNTGQTVFVEPSELVEAGNELALAEAEAKEEARRILV
ncbi:MAG: endonuclease MutS2, partial [Deltaproteobacteria bacterium]